MTLIDINKSRNKNECTSRGLLKIFVYKVFKIVKNHRNNVERRGNQC